MATRRRTRAQGGSNPNDDQNTADSPNHQELSPEFARLSISAPVESRHILRIGRHLQNLDLRSYPENLRQGQSYSTWEKCERISKLILWFCSVVLALALTATVIYGAYIFVIGTKKPNFPDLPVFDLPKKIPLKTRKDLYNIHFKYEEATKPFKDIRHSIENSQIFSKDELIALLAEHRNFEKEMHDELGEQYSTYVAFIRQTIRDLQVIKEATTEEIPEDWYKEVSFWEEPTMAYIYSPLLIFEDNPPTNAEQLLKQYQGFLEAQQNNYRRSMFLAYEIFRPNDKCHLINETLNRDMKEIRDARSGKWQAKQTLRTLEEVQKDLEGACQYEKAVVDISKTVVEQLYFAFEESMKDAKRVPRYIMHWKYGIGRTNQDKKKFHDRKVFEVTGQSIDKAIVRFAEMLV